jgi:putative oxidoreductase
MQRLYSSFARGWPGMGLLVLRVTAAITAFHFSGSALSLSRSSMAVIEGALALLLCAGLWTPIAGSMLAGLAVWAVFSRTGDPWALILLAAVGVALAALRARPCGRVVSGSPSPALSRASRAQARPTHGNSEIRSPSTSPRSQDIQSPRSQDIQSPRSADFKKTSTLVSEAEVACKAGKSSVAATRPRRRWSC